MVKDRKEYFKQYYEKNKEEIQKYRREWHQANKKKQNLRSNKYYLEHKEKIDKQIKKWKIENKDKHNLHAEKYRKKHPKKIIARQMVNNRLPIKSSCEICSSRGRLERHHWRYDKPLEVNTLCKFCHNVQHINKGGKKTWEN